MMDENKKILFSKMMKDLDVESCSKECPTRYDWGTVLHKKIFRGRFETRGNFLKLDHVLKAKSSVYGNVMITSIYNEAVDYDMLSNWAESNNLVMKEYDSYYYPGKTRTFAFYSKRGDTE